MDIYLIADAELSSYLTLFLNIGKAAIGLGFVIFVHELGHFAVAKMCGVKCEKFYIGFDVPIKIGPIRFPRRICRFQWGETEYGIGIIPLGGYVKMLGQDDDPRNFQREVERTRVPKTSESATERDKALAAGTASEGLQPGTTVEREYELDPRSYPAKSVPARMAIISAGVIMNLIFAVLMAAVAFRVGVPYGPTIVGSTTPGDPAWEAGLDRMDRFVQIGDDGKPSRHLRWQWDLLQSVGEAGLSKTPEPITFLVQKAGADEPVRYELTPSERMKAVNGFAALGIRSLGSTTLATDPGLPHVLPNSVLDQLRKGDRAVAINGIELSREHANWQGDLPDIQYDDLMYDLRDETVTITFERPENPDHPEGSPTTKFDVTLPPRPERTLGAVMSMGKIVGIQKGSPAEKAGIQKGDIIRSINGEPVGDPLRLPDRIAALPSGDIALEVERQDGDATKTVAITVSPRTVREYDSLAGRGELMAVNSLGIAYEINTVIAEVVAGSPADKSGLKPGDEVTNVEFITADEEKQKLSAAKISPFWYSDEGKAVDLAEKLFTWADIHAQIQYMLPDTKVALTFTRDGKSDTKSLAAVDAANWFNPNRGLVFQPYEELHQVDSFAAAIPAGLHRTKQELGRVAAMLKKLFTFQISVKHLGGPITIAAVAGSEAAQGIPQLIMFLVMLSANLAILNFLPIPALDGGHFVFLLWEGLTGRPADERVQGTLTLIGVACLLGLILFVSLNDVGRLFF